MKGNSLNRFNPFRWIRNIIWDIQFWIKEFKLEEEVEREIDHAEGYCGHGSMTGFNLYKQYEQEHEERKRLQEL